MDSFWTCFMFAHMDEQMRWTCSLNIFPSNHPAFFIDAITRRGSRIRWIILSSLCASKISLIPFSPFCGSLCVNTLVTTVFEPTQDDFKMCHRHLCALLDILLHCPGNVDSFSLLVRKNFSFIKKFKYTLVANLHLYRSSITLNLSSS